MPQFIDNALLKYFGRAPTIKVDRPTIPLVGGPTARMAAKLTDIIETIAAAGNWSIQRMIDMDGVQSKNSFTMNENGLIGAIEIKGSYSQLTAEEVITNALALEQEWSTILSTKGVTLDWCVYGGDPEMVRKQIKDILAPTYATLDRLQLDLGHIYDEQVDLMADINRYEKSYLCLWVTPDIFDKHDRNVLATKQQEKMREAVLSGSRALGLYEVAELIDNRFEAYMDSLINGLNARNYRVKRITCEELLSDLRRQMERQTSYSWKPMIDGAPISRKTLPNPDDLSHLMPPPINEQLFPNEVGSIVDTLNTIDYGGRLHSGVVVKTPCKNVYTFRYIFDLLREADIPYRIRMTMTGDGHNATGLKLKEWLAFAVSWSDISSSNNKPMHAALKQIQEVAGSGDHQFVSFRMCAETWVNLESDDPKDVRAAKKKLAGNVEKLSRAIQSWGVMETNQKVGDPLMLSIASLPGLRRSIPCEDSVPPLADAMQMAPLTRMAEMWDSGALLLRTQDGKTIPCDPVSNIQEELSEMWIGRPGYGKSVAMSARTLATIARAGNNEIPYSFFIDIGYSSSGIVSLIKDALPEGKKYLAQHYKISNTSSDRINPFDTLLGARHPIGSHREALINLLSLLVSDGIGENEAVDKFNANIIAEALNKIYMRFSDTDGRPKLYEPLVNKVVDSKVAELGIHLDQGKVSWFSLTDQFIERGEYHAATLAQRYAVPTLSDVGTFVTEQGAVSEKYLAMKASNFRYVDEFSLLIKGAIDKYPILSGVTSFDTGAARLVALDIEDICGSPSSAAGKKKTALAYMLTRQMFMSKIALRRKDLKATIGDTNKPIFKDNIHRLHLKRVMYLEKTVKTLSYDEIHRARGVPSVFVQWVTDERLARKYKIKYAFSTQSHLDIDKELFGLISCKVFMGVSEKEADLLCDELEFNDDLRRFLKRAKRPSRKGSVGVWQVDTKKGAGKYTGIFGMPLPNSILWGTSTTAEDDNLRKHVYELMGFKRGLEELCKHFPNHTCAPYLEELEQANRSDRKVDFTRDIAERIQGNNFNKAAYLNEIGRLH